MDPMDLELYLSTLIKLYPFVLVSVLINIVLQVEEAFADLPLHYLSCADKFNADIFFPSYNIKIHDLTHDAIYFLTHPKKSA